MTKALVALYVADFYGSRKTLLRDLQEVKADEALVIFSCYNLVSLFSVNISPLMIATIFPASP